MKRFRDRDEEKIKKLRRIQKMCTSRDPEMRNLGISLAKTEGFTSPETEPQVISGLWISSKINEYINLYL